MFLIFNKQFRTEQKIINELMKKVKNTKKVIKSLIGNSEKYELDTLDITFNVTKPQKFVVADKTGEEIVSMDCEFQDGNEIQCVRFNWFSELLKAAREREQKEIYGRVKEDQIMAARRALEAAVKAQKEKEAIEAAMCNSLKRIKKL